MLKLRKDNKKSIQTRNKKFTARKTQQKSKDKIKRNNLTTNNYKDDVNVKLTANRLKNGSKNKLTEIEADLLKNGTKKDKVNILCLTITKNPTNSLEEFNNLLEMCQDERYDIVFYILKNITDLLLTNFTFNNESLPLKRKLINTIEFYLRNIFIKEKIMKLIYGLLCKNKLFMDLIYIFTNKIGDKKTTGTLTIKYIKLLYQQNVNNELVLYALEDFYERDVKSRKKVIGLINILKGSEMQNSGLFTQFFNDMKKEGKIKDKCVFESKLNQIVKGLIETKGEINDLDESKLKHVYNNSDLNYNILVLLYTKSSPNFHNQLLKVIRSLKMMNSNHVKWLNLIYEYLKVEDLIEKKIIILESLLSTGIFFDDSFIMAILFITGKTTEDKQTDFKSLFTIDIYKHHGNDVIRFLANMIVNNEKIDFFDPYNADDLRRMKLLSKNI